MAEHFPCIYGLMTFKRLEGVHRINLPQTRFSRIVKAMDVHFTPEQEAQLTQLATRAGTDAEQLVKDTVLRLIEDESRFRRPALELPVWNLGAIGSLHRRDLYDDVR